MTMDGVEHDVDFYPRPPRGGRLIDYIKTCRHSIISIHALREEGDLRKTVDRPEPSGFLSTPSARRATSKRGRFYRFRHDFYPRPPRGGRQANL